MGIRLAAAMGNTVTAISTSPKKKEAAMKIGAKNFVVSKDEEQMKAAARSLDLILNTVSANHQESDIFAYVKSMHSSALLIIFIS